MSTELKFTETHEWLQGQHSEVTIGISDHAQKLLGDMVFVEMPEIGDEFEAGDEIGVVESVKAASDFYAPIGGTVIEINEAVVANPALVNSSPLKDGWLVKLRPHDVNEINQLLSETQYLDKISKEG
jgi:glycine cleavage system H protein